VAATCLQGLAGSGQVQLAVSSSGVAGKRESPAAVNASSTSRGISPARSAARKSAWPASASSARAHSSSVKGTRPILTRYGARSEPCTKAVTRPGSTCRSITWPLRA
jgi:hypothetical protein